MGASASIATANDEDLIKSFLEVYAQDPKKIDRVILEGKKRHAERALEHQNAPDCTSIASQSLKSALDVSMTDDDEFNVELTKLLNFARSDPLGFSTKYLEPHLKRFIDEYVYRTTDPDAESIQQNVRTTEGRMAVIEAIGFCKQHAKLEPKPPLQYIPWLAHASQDHVNDIGITGSIEHAGADGSSTADRVSRYCVWTETVGENIDFGNSRPDEIIIALIVDDGTASRGHRTNIFNPKFRKVGAALGRHKGYKYCCVMDFAGGVKDINSVVLENSQVTCIGEMTPAFKKVLFSIPGDQNNELCLMLEEKLAKNSKLMASINFMYTEAKAEISIRDGNEINTINITWGNADRTI